MKPDMITDDMRVWDVIQRYPQTFDVFRKHGCPDMKKGIYAVSARFMKVRWAAKMHKIPTENLVRDLNDVLKVKPGQTGEDEAA